MTKQCQDESCFISHNITMNNEICPTCNYKNSVIEGVYCFGCGETYCEKCWDTIEVPNGADDGDIEMFLRCIAKFESEHGSCVKGEGHQRWDCKCDQQLKPAMRKIYRYGNNSDYVQ